MPRRQLDSRDCAMVQNRPLFLGPFPDSTAEKRVAQTDVELLAALGAGQPTLILRSPDFHSITEAVAEPVERRTPIGWWLFFLPSLALLGLLGVAVSLLFWEGIGMWRLNV